MKKEEILSHASYLIVWNAADSRTSSFADARKVLQPLNK